ncbi:tRNA threonylcarbamoyladenosine dehydratase [Aromatoleum diolicum]|uniref:tRNA cyclic N6-threonylcarbamoyladenosine(37) synthase TcdA n=1 Tax=Aromatoleum diolicum TaxID=75796 RepID=A0ABX1Q6T3_9RHOO|nr:tRNA threonylcarbamoyladenosine dehydratase [Aromatoleum diolicum]NMG73770.1 tRNA cyclic N6-threonylcarbamoyladenosine(37) synthase TcdA [Aromatoleum diolicum]
MSGLSIETTADVDRERRFGGIARLYGAAAPTRLERAHACVIGVGGVGSWIAEALARSGVGQITLIDLDHVAESNINRQIHALDPTLGQAKVLAMAERIRAINPHAHVATVEDFVTPDNADELLRDFDVVVDAIDNVRAKVAIVLVCKRRRIPLIVAGGAGGKTDPAKIRVDDLSRTEQDPLLAKVRKRLRAEHGFPRNPKRPFGIEAVYSCEPLRLDDLACDLPHGPQGLACAGYGSSVAVTASVGMFAAARAIERLLAAPVDASPDPVETQA